MFDENPFKCINCGDEMILWEVWHYKYGTLYDVLDKSNYRNIIDDDIDKNKELKNNMKYISEQMELF